MPQSAGCLRSPRALWHPPIDAFQQIAKLRRRDRYRPVSRRWPDEAATFQSLRKQAHTLAVMPQHLDQPAALAAEHEQMPAVRITLELLLNQKCQPIKALAHVGVAARQPHPRPARQRNHHRRSIAPITRARALASTVSSTMIRAPDASTISIRPVATAAVSGWLPAARSHAITAPANVTVPASLPKPPARAKRRQLNSWAGDNPCRRAVAETCRG